VSEFRIIDVPKGVRFYLFPLQEIHWNFVIGSSVKSYHHKHKKLKLSDIDKAMKQSFAMRPILVAESQDVPDRTSTMGWICGNRDCLSYVYVSPPYRSLGIATKLLDVIGFRKETTVEWMTPAGKKLIEAFRASH
jgi:GNAT superfamily N-acetyltransferase